MLRKYVDVAVMNWLTVLRVLEITSGYHRLMKVCVGGFAMWMLEDSQCGCCVDHTVVDLFLV
jgi:hypothetical protein